MRTRVESHPEPKSAAPVRPRNRSSRGAQWTLSGVKHSRKSGKGPEVSVEGRTLSRERQRGITPCQVHLTPHNRAPHEERAGKRIRSVQISACNEPVGFAANAARRLGK